MCGYGLESAKLQVVHVLVPEFSVGMLAYNKLAWTRLGVFLTDLDRGSTPLGLFKIPISTV